MLTAQEKSLLAPARTVVWPPLLLPVNRFPLTGRISLRCPLIRFPTLTGVLPTVMDRILFALPTLNATLLVRLQACGDTTLYNEQALGVRRLMWRGPLDEA